MCLFIHCVNIYIYKHRYTLTNICVQREKKEEGWGYYKKIVIKKKRNGEMDIERQMRNTLITTTCP